MNNIYFLEGETLLLNKKIEEILKENKQDKKNLITYDMEEVNISNAIMDLDTYSFFNETKVVYCKNATFLTSIKSDIEHDYDLFTKYINNPNSNNILIISCSKADSKKNIVKLLKEKAKYYVASFDSNSYVKDLCKGYKISASTISYLLSNTGDDVNRITNEINKLLELKKKEKEITNSDVDMIVIKKIDNNIFDLIDAIISKNKKKSLEIYDNMINYGEDVFKIFIFLANQIRLIYQIKVLKELSNDEIASRLNLKNPKQVAALRFKIDKYSESDLISYLHRLAIMDEELKTGKAIDKIVFPIFIASL